MKLYNKGLKQVSIVVVKKLSIGMFGTPRPNTWQILYKSLV
jgi:hypothetical protein